MSRIKISENSKNNEDEKSLIDIIHQIESAGKELDAINIETMFLNSTNSLCHNQEIRFKELMSQIEIFKRKGTADKYLSRDNNSTSLELSKQGSLKYQMIYFPEKAKVEDMARLSNLEKRIGHLENIIGFSTSTTSKYSQLLKSQGISQSIEKLMANACLLNSTQLDILENKVTTLLHKMDNVAQKKMILGHESNYEQIISELYDVVKSSEKYSQILPQTIDRMLLLSHLHQKAADFSNQLRELENFKQSIDGALTNNKTILEEVQKNFSKNLEMIVNDVTVLTDRIRNLKN